MSNEGIPKFHLANENEKSPKAKALNDKMSEMDAIMDPIADQIEAGLVRVREESVSRDMGVAERQAYYKALQEKIDAQEKMITEYNSLLKEYLRALQEENPQK